MIFVVNSTAQCKLSLASDGKFNRDIEIQDPFTDNFPFKLERIKEIFPTFENLL